MKSLSNKKLIEAYDYFRKSGLQIDFMEYLGLRKTTPPETLTYMGFVYKLDKKLK